MHDHLLSWKELAAQLRVDSIRCSTAAGSGHPTSSLSAADLMAVLIARYLKYDWKARVSEQRSADFQQRPRLAAAVCHLQGRRRDHGRRAAFLSKVRQPFARASESSGAAVGRSGDRLAGPGVGHWRRHGAQRQIPRRVALPHLGPAWRRRNGRRLRMGSVRQGVSLRSQSSGRPHRHESAGAAWRDRVGMEQRGLRRPRSGIRLELRRD